jgi:dihydrofolate reductase
MPVSIIAAVARNGVIGKGGRLPWRLPEDLAFFKRVTMGHPVIMGRRTMESIGKPLSGRKNIVLSRDPGFNPEGWIAARTAEEALEISGGGEVFVVGGASVYGLFFPMAARLYITHIDADFQGDAVFPAFDEREWRVVRSEPGIVDAKNAVPHRFVVYERKSR